MKKLSNLEFKKKFDTIADTYEKVSNSYTITRRAESFKIDSAEVILETGSGTGIISGLIDKSIILFELHFLIQH